MPSGGGATLGDEGAAYSNYYNRRADWGPSENDIRHRFTFSSVYQLPFGKRRAFLQQGPMRYIAGGWSVSTVMTLQTGAPITVQTQTNSTNANSAGAQRADVLRDPNLPTSERTVQRWFDTLGLRPAGAVHVRQPGRRPGARRRQDQHQLLRCCAISRWRERKQLQFRGEFFNLPNHPNFGNPTHQFEGAGFRRGELGAAGAPGAVGAAVDVLKRSGAGPRPNAI